MIEFIFNLNESILFHVEDEIFLFFSIDKDCYGNKYICSYLLFQFSEYRICFEY